MRLAELLAVSLSGLHVPSPGPAEVACRRLRSCRAAATELLARYEDGATYQQRVEEAAAPMAIAGA